MPRNEQVTIILDGKSAKLVQAWQQARAAAQQFEDGMRQASSTSQRTTNQASTQWQQVSKQIRNTALQVVGLNTALSAAQTFMRAVGREFQVFQQTKLGQAERDVGAGAALAKAIGAFTASPGLSMAQLPGRLRQASNRTELPFSMVADAATGMFSGAGSFSNEQALQSFELAAQLNPDLVVRQDSEGIQNIARAQMALARSSGKSLRQAGGIGKRFFKAAAVTDSGEFAKNVAPAIIALSQMSTSKKGDKDDIGFLMETLAAFTVLAGDDTGRRSSTNLAVAFANLAQFMATEGETGTLEEMTNKLRNNEDLRKRFGGFLTTLPNEELARKGKELFGDDFEVQGSIGGEARTRAIAAALFTPGSKFDEERAKAREKLFAGGSLEDATDQELAIAERIRGMPEFTSARIQMRHRNLREQATIFDPVSANMAAAQEASETRTQFGQLGFLNMIQRNMDQFVTSAAAEDMDAVRRMHLGRLAGLRAEAGLNRGSAAGNFAEFFMPGAARRVPFAQGVSQQRLDILDEAVAGAGGDIGAGPQQSVDASRQFERLMRSGFNPFGPFGEVIRRVEVINQPVQPPQLPDGGL